MCRPGATNVVAIAAGDNFNLALRGDGSIVGWGENQDGRISGIPTGTNFLAIAAGGSHCARPDHYRQGGGSGAIPVRR